MRLAKAINIADIERLARRRLPRILYDVIASGVEDERSLRASREAFERFRLLPRLGVEVRARSQRRELLGKSYESPFGIAPTGVAGIFRKDAELLLARAAAKANIPFVMSGSSIASIEAVGQSAAPQSWFQLYAARDDQITQDMLDRAQKAGFTTLVLTIDTPVIPKRERDIRNGFSLPLRPPLGVILEAVMHLGWLFDYLRAGHFFRDGVPPMMSWAPYARDGAGACEIAQLFGDQRTNALTWQKLEALRRRWPGHFVVKGILRPSDAVRAVEVGADAVAVSNHGAKALDAAISPIECLYWVRRAVGPSTVVTFDSGIRRGSDIVVALCLGADFVFVGRPTLYGVCAHGEAGAARAIEILQQEIDLTLGLVGAPSINDLGEDFLVTADLLRSPIEQSGNGLAALRESDNLAPRRCSSGQPSG